MTKLLSLKDTRRYRQMSHRHKDCPLVERFIACEQCGYPYSEALYFDWNEYILALSSTGAEDHASKKIR